MEHPLVRIFILAVLAYVGYALLCFLVQRTIIYPGRSLSVAGQPPDLPDIHPLWLTTPYGHVESWFLPATGSVAGGRRPVVLFFHGNGEVIDVLPDQAEGFRRMGMHVMLVEYPGYGRSGGSPSEEGITAAAVAAYDELVRRSDTDSGRMIAFGRSLGCGAACALSLRRPLAALILQSPFTSTRPFARQMLLPGFLARDVFDNRKALESYGGAVLILHGTEDDIIPVGHGRELARTVRRGCLIELRCGHNDCPPDWLEFWRIIEGFLEQEGVSGRK